MDRLEEIKDYLRNQSDRSPAFENVSEWLIAEVDRLRKIEDAAIDWHEWRNKPPNPVMRSECANRLSQTINDSPRPTREDADG